MTSGTIDIIENSERVDASIARDRAMVTPGIDRAARPGAARFLTEARDERAGDGATRGVKARIDVLTGFLRQFRLKAQATRRAQRRRMSVALAQDCERQASERRKLAGEIRQADLEEMRP